MSSPYLALPLGAQPGDRDRRTARDHDRFLSSGLVSDGVRRVVLESWQRSRASGVNADAVLPPVELTDDELEDYRDAHPLAPVMPVIRRLLVDDAVDCDLLVAVSDNEGRLLWVEGSPSLRLRAEAMNFLPGARWSEEHAGTNAPGTALALDHGLQIFAHEHYGRIVQPWSCTAVPIHDPFTSEIVGVLDVTGGDLVATPQSMALVQATVHAVESELRLQAMTQGSKKLLRAARRARLDLRQLEVLGVDHAVLRIGGERRVLSQRHSEILLLLCAHPDGLTAEQLAIELHAEDFPLVTVRAEMSRLRSALGPLAPSSRPYRLPHGLSTDVSDVDAAARRGELSSAMTAYRGPVLPHSEAPGVVRIRRRLHDRLRAAVLASGDGTLVLRWAETGWAQDDPEVWATALRLLPHGSAEHALARIRLAALDDEFGASPGH
jgi:transcriptional regulator of acetoin/glycerol metabolism